RRGMHYLRSEKLYGDMQVFNLSILPGTAFRQEATELGLRFQPRPPYYVLGTPALGLPDLYQLMEEAREIFEIEFDPQPSPTLEFADGDRDHRVLSVDLDREVDEACPDQHHQAFTLWLRSSHFARQRSRVSRRLRQILAANPFTTLQVILEAK